MCGNGVANAFVNACVMYCVNVFVIICVNVFVNACMALWMLL